MSRVICENDFIVISIHRVVSISYYNNPTSVAQSCFSNAMIYRFSKKKKLGESLSKCRPTLTDIRYRPRPTTFFITHFTRSRKSRAFGWSRHAFRRYIASSFLFVLNLTRFSIWLVVSLKANKRGGWKTKKETSVKQAGNAVCLLFARFEWYLRDNSIKNK